MANIYDKTCIVHPPSVEWDQYYYYSEVGDDGIPLGIKHLLPIGGKPKNEAHVILYTCPCGPTFIGKGPAGSNQEITYWLHK